MLPPLDQEHDARGYPPIVTAELIPDSKAKIACDELSEQEDDPKLFDTGLVCQIAILGFVIAAQVFNVI